MKLFYSDVFVLPLPGKHRFPMEKYRLLREKLMESQIFQRDEFCIPDAASDDQLRLVHSQAYIEKIRNGHLSRIEERRIGFPWSTEMFERSIRSTGASICAGRIALQDGVSANLAGGTHHAFADSGEGYCVFNDVCVAARVLQREGLIERVLVVDCDVHQGNGTADIVSADPTIFTLSIHCEKNFPFRKKASDIDVALPEGTGDDEYLLQLNQSLGRIDNRFTPDLVFYVAGADPYVGDRLGRLSLTKDGLRQRDQAVYQWCDDREIPVSVCMAGGYANDVSDIVDIHFATIVEGRNLLSGAGS